MTDLTPNVFPVSFKFMHDIAKALYSEKGLVPSTAYSVGVDLRACLAEELTITPGERHKVSTGIAIEPKAPGIAGFIYSRSGLGAMHGLIVAQGVGVIDPDYRGEIFVFLLNTSTATYTVNPGERIAQIVFQPYLQPQFQQVKQLGDTTRGQGGFGHTGK